MKKIIIASILVVGLVAGFAFAHNNSGGYGMRSYGGHMMDGNYGMKGHGGHMMGGNYGMMGPGMMHGVYDDCPGAAWFGKDGWNSEEHQNFLDETVDLRRELNDKRFAFVEAQRNPDTTRAQLAEMEKELINIQAKIEEKAKQLQ